MTQPLDNIVVLDFTTGRAGSVATMVLSDFGAEVIKVEPPEGDPYRQFPQSLLWNRGKKSVVLDLNTPEGKERARGLLMQADVVVESFRPGEADALGIGYDEVSAQRPTSFTAPSPPSGPRGRTLTTSPTTALWPPRWAVSPYSRASQSAPARTTPPCRSPTTAPPWQPSGASCPRSSCVRRRASGSTWKPA